MWMLLRWRTPPRSDWFVSPLEPFEGGLLVAEGFEEGIGESLRIERRFREPGNGFFDFDCVQR